MVLGVPLEHEGLVPKLLLGNVIGAQALLGQHAVIKRDFFLISLAKQSFASKWVPKQELGNQKKVKFR
jgi:hypothetical protein